MTTEKQKCILSSLAIGTIFEYTGVTYMRVSMAGMGINTLKLSTGDLYALYEDEEVLTDGKGYLDHCQQLYNDAYFDGFDCGKKLGG